MAPNKHENRTPTTKRDKVFTIIGIVLCIILIPMLIVNVTMIVKSYINEDEVPGFMGMTPLIVLTDSMQDVIYSGDLIFCFEVDTDELEKDDIISFYDPASNKGSVVTHRIIGIIENEDGTRSFQTMGDNNNTEDKLPVPAADVIGEYRFRIAGAGNIAMFMQSTGGLILCVFVPLILIVGYDILRRRLYEQNKQQNIDDLMAELNALRAAQNNSAESAPDTKPTEQSNEENKEE